MRTSAEGPDEQLRRAARGMAGALSDLALEAFRVILREPGAVRVLLGEICREQARRLERQAAGERTAAL